MTDFRKHCPSFLVVSGLLHCILMPYWAQQNLQIKPQITVIFQIKVYFGNFYKCTEKNGGISDGWEKLGVIKHFRDPLDTILISYCLVFVQSDLEPLPLIVFALVCPCSVSVSPSFWWALTPWTSATRWWTTPYTLPGWAKWSWSTHGKWSMISFSL